MMNTKIRILIVIHIFFALNVNASEAVLEENIANLWINDLDHHTDVALLKEGDQYYIECNILAERQITTSQLKTLSSRPEFCSVSSGVIQSAFDDSSQSIKLTIPTDSFESDFNNLNGSVIPEKASFGGFINYDFLYATSNSNNSYSGLMELGVFKDYWIMKNSMLYQNTPTDERVVRLSSSVDFEFPKHMTRLTIGDTTTTLIWFR